MPARAALVLPLLAAALVASTPAGAEDAVPAARALLAAWHQDPARIDRARALLETAAADAVPETLVELSRVWFLTGEFRARSHAERVTAYERGSEWARRGIGAAPGSDRAHFLLAINSGRLAEMKGVMRALPLVSKIREESETVLRLNPSSVDGLILAASSWPGSTWPPGAGAKLSASCSAWWTNLRPRTFPGGRSASGRGRRGCSPSSTSGAGS